MKGRRISKDLWKKVGGPEQKACLLPEREVDGTQSQPKSEQDVPQEQWKQLNPRQQEVIYWNNERAFWRTWNEVESYPNR